MAAWLSPHGYPHPKIHISHAAKEFAPVSLPKARWPLGALATGDRPLIQRGNSENHQRNGVLFVAKSYEHHQL